MAQGAGRSMSCKHAAILSVQEGAQRIQSPESLGAAQTGRAWIAGGQEWLNNPAGRRPDMTERDIIELVAIPHLNTGIVVRNDKEHGGLEVEAHYTDADGNRVGGQNNRSTSRARPRYQ